jgi:hypothetical protein
VSPSSRRDTLGQVTFERDVKDYDTLFYDTIFWLVPTSFYISAYFIGFLILCLQKKHFVIEGAWYFAYTRIS